MKKGPYRGGKVHVMSEQCETCIFRPGNLMHLQPGRLKGMVDDTTKNQSSITCHHALYGELPPAVCRGFYDRYKTVPLLLAEAMEMVVFQEGSH